MESEERIKFLAFGNAILDMSKRLSSDAIHKKFNLKADDQLEVDYAVLEAVKEHIDKVKGNLHTNPGGSALNTCRILNQLGFAESTFCGAIGNDPNGNRLTDLLHRENIHICLQILRKYRTAFCICLVYGEARCLLANIGAAQHFSCRKTVQKLATNIPAGICYIEGYFLPEKREFCEFIYETVCANQSSVDLAMNLNAVYIVRGFIDDILWLFNRSKFIFGNHSEFNQLLAETRVDSIAELMEESVLIGEQFCVITNGGEEVSFFHKNGNGVTSGSVKVPAVSKAAIIDTTGAGDSFVAGFFNAYFRGKSTIPCIEKGIKVAKEKLSHHGCNIK